MFAQADRLKQRRVEPAGGGKIGPSTLVFPNGEDGPRHPDGMSKEWALIMKELGIAATFHALRHTHASILIADGIDVSRSVVELGHGSPAITLRVYAHLFRPDDRAAETIQRALAAPPSALARFAPACGKTRRCAGRPARRPQRRSQAP
jgi:integrase